MKEKRSRGLATIRVSGVLLVAFMFMLAGSWRASAQEATPSPEAEDMGVCTEALGFGEEGDACVSVVHASPDAPAVDVWVDGEPALIGLTFGTYSGWVTLPAGDHQVQVAPAGTVRKPLESGNSRSDTRTSPPVTATSTAGASGEAWTT